MTEQDVYLAERATALLADNALATALTEIRMDALLALGTVDPASFKQITQLQAIVHCTDEIVAKLRAMITKTGVHDGGLSMTAARKANTA